MGKKAKKAAAVRAAKEKTRHRADEKSGKAGKPGATVCTGSTPQERHRQSRVESSEFYRVASLFGIQGEDPSEFEFKHPEHNWPHQKIHEESSNPIYNALWEAIIDEYEIYQKWRRANARGFMPVQPMTWQHACRNMMLNALGRLRHKRRQRKYRDKKMANHAKQDTKSQIQDKMAAKEASPTKGIATAGTQKKKVLLEARF